MPGLARDYYSSWLSVSQSARVTNVQKGGRTPRYSNLNCRTFGQEAHEEFVPNGQDQEDEEEKEEDLELESYKSVQRQDLQTTKGEAPEKPSLKTAKASNESKSRLGTIILEQSWFTVYKRLFLASFMLNILGLLSAITGHFQYARSRAVLFSLGNIFMCVLVRNEVFLRVLFWLAVQLLGYRWIPVKLKTMVTAFLQSVGGIHSGCGLGSIIWLVYALLLSPPKRHIASNEMLAVGVGILVLLLLSSSAAFPILRHIHHNFFERVHRFAGWSSLGLVWTFVILSSFWNSSTQSYQISDNTREALVRKEALWLTVAVTLIIILPWVSVRKVSVETVVPPSKLNSLLHFEGGVAPGLLARVSPSPFSEWHAFGIISDGQKRKTILAGAVGDFTKSLVENPPAHIWIRTFHFSGLPYLTNMYQKALLVATGSGICVFFSFLLQPTKANVHMIWIAKKIRESYGDGMWEAIKNIPDEKLTLIDTAVSGRPKSTRELVVTKAKEHRAEVVIVTSNPSGTNDVLNGCKAVGIPAFGPIWDS